MCHNHRMRECKGDLYTSSNHLEGKKEHQATWYQESNLHPDWKLANSANGWTTDDRPLVKAYI